MSIHLRFQQSSPVTQVRIFLACGPIALFFVLLFLGVSHFFPPIQPSLTPDETAKHYLGNLRGVRAGILFFIIGSIIWPFYGLGINSQLCHIPNVNTHLLSLQLSSGCVAGATMMFIGSCFAATIYRLDRDPLVTQALSDLSFFVWTAASAAWFPQEVAISLALLSDRRHPSLVPHWVSWLNLALTFTWIPAYGSHFVYHGIIAWDGAVTFWMLLGTYGTQFSLVVFYLFKNTGQCPVTRCE